MTLLEKCNADVFKAIIDHKNRFPESGEMLIQLLKKCDYWGDLSVAYALYLSSILPENIWNGKVYNFHHLFESKQTTTMP